MKAGEKLKISGKGNIIGNAGSPLRNSGTLEVVGNATLINYSFVSSVIVDVTNTRVVPSLGNRRTACISLAGPQPRTAALIWALHNECVLGGR